MRKVPLADPSRFVDANRTELLSATEKIFNGGRYVLGPNVDAFEHEFASYVGTSSCISVANGTDALELALKASNVHGREVIIAPNAGGYSAVSTTAAGGTPKWADVDSMTLLMDCDSIMNLVSHATAAIVITHLYGLAFDVAELRTRLAEVRRSDVVIIEDCAQAHGAKINGQRVGSIGDMGCFSFYPTKNLGAIGDGGAVVTSNKDLNERLRLLRQYGWQDRYIQIFHGGRNSRLDEIQAAILLTGLKSLDERNSRRRSIIKRYSEAGIPVVHGRFAESDQYVAHLAICRDINRGSAVSAFEEFGVSTAIHYPVLDHDMPIYRDGAPSRTPNAARSVEEIYTLPCFPELRDDEVDQVISVFKEHIRLGQSS